VTRVTWPSLVGYSDDPLPFGLYERLITANLKAKLLEFDPARGRITKSTIEKAEAHLTLARHIEAAVARALRSLPADEREAAQVSVVNDILNGLKASGELLDTPVEQLDSIVPATTGFGESRSIVAPLVPLSASDLLVNARGEPCLAHALAHEIPSADSIDLLCAFVRWHGLRVLEDQLRAHCQAGRPLRVITTVYTGSTERKALDWLVSLGAEVKISYDTLSTRLHAKAWLFRRNTGFSTAYIGSSNLSKSALIDGVEWNVRLSQVTSSDLLDKFDATFDSYWQSPEYQDYDPARDASRFDRAVAPNIDSTDATPFLFLDVTPWPHQTEILEKLTVERERHGRHRNLVVAATGTGKTIVSALDFKRLRSQIGNPSLLFVAHRQEILRQSLSAFRQVLRDGAFGELYVDGHRPDEWRHVFASVQGLAQQDLSTIDPKAFDVVIVDEFHHATAPTYRRLLEHLQPRELLGLTATPERTDSTDVLHYFDGHIAAELRLWDALERGLLCPFQYFGVSDNTDLSAIQWSRQGYDVAQLERLYTGDDARVNLVLQQLEKKLRDPGAMRALGFCVSIEHARFMARRFTDAGLPAQSVTADTDRESRKTALTGLQNGALRALFTVDLFNEGVDIPSVDTLLFLRPTESALVFMQQLGRGLRRFEGKDCVTVLDFIGQSHRKFRFDLRYRAVTGTGRTEVTKQIQQGFPFLPAGCTMQLDRVAKEIVLNNLREAVPSRRPAMIRELKALAESRTGERVSLEIFLAETDLELVDVYRSGCWSSLQREAGLPVDPAGPEEPKVGVALQRLLHIDDPLRLAAYRDWAKGAAADPRLIVSLVHTLWTENKPVTISDAAARLQSHPAIATELAELMGVLEARAAHLPVPFGAAPLSIHARHSLNDILAAFGIITIDKCFQPQAGVYFDAPTNTDLFFVTIEKSERDYSPQTLYKDYAISPTLFHWESQSSTSQASPTGQRYIHHREQGSQVLLFVRARKRQDGLTMPYTFLGPADYVSHQQERPIQFTWRLQRPMPADFFRQAKVAAG
jgi:superfamily II DNA or RNA helicase/HKD family nuclease